MQLSSGLDIAAAAMLGRLADLDFACLDASELVDLIGDLERLKNAAAAVQARASVALRRLREAEANAAGRDPKKVCMSVAGEIGLARHESPHRALRLLGLAAALNELPSTMALFTAGDLSEWRATLVARETACLTRDDRLRVDTELGPQLAHASDRRLVAEARAIAYRLDPHSVVERVARAEADRRVTIRPAPDCMALISALLPVAQGVAVYAALTRHATTLRTTGDTRSKGQLMADSLVTRVTGQVSADAVPVEVQLVITDQALLGSSDTPARLGGFGPVPAGIARRLAATATEAGQAWVRRLYTRPGIGRLVAMESKRRHFPAGLAAYITARDEVCRTPWCGAAIRHTDHIVPVHLGGSTTAANGQGLCEQCNYLKEHPGWHHRAEPDGTVSVRTPTGIEHQHRPPDLPHESAITPFTVDLRYSHAA